MEKAGVTTALLIGSAIPYFHIYMNLICVGLFGILAVNIFVLLRRCKDRQRRIDNVRKRKGELCERTAGVNRPK